MTNQITQKFIDLLGPITEDRLSFSTSKTYTTAVGNLILEISKVQKELTEEYLKDHFKFREIKWIDHVGGASEPGKAVETKTTKLGDDNTTYEGKTGYIFQIMFTPRIYDPKTIYNAVKDGCTITPMIYNPETFTPYRQIVLTWSPEQAQDFPFTNSEEVMKQTLRDQLEKVLANPEEYMPEGIRGVMIRFAAK